MDLIIALWAPADLIIEDPTGYALLDLAERREYASSDDDSRYAIVYRFNRTA